MIQLGVCGFGYSGSGAVLDLLKDYPEVYVADHMELSFMFKPDGLDDLKEALSNPVRHWSSDSAIRRFIKQMKRQARETNKYTNGEYSKLVDSFVKSIIQVQWTGYTGTHFYQDQGLVYLWRQEFLLRVRLYLERFFGPGTYWGIAQKKMFYSDMTEEEFNHKAKGFVEGLLQVLTRRPDAKIMAVDQFFSANDPERSFCYLSNPAAIIVIRDPRDTYLLAKKHIGLWGSFIPTKDVNSFITYYKGMMKTRKPHGEKVLDLLFEDLVYDTDNARKSIERFLNLDASKVAKPSHFCPEVSINNTQLWLRDNSYKNDISLIEMELADYLYDFSRFTAKPTFNSTIF